MEPRTAAAIHDVLPLRSFRGANRFRSRAPVRRAWVRPSVCDPKLRARARRALDHAGARGASPPDPPRWPRLSLIIPACNEAASLSNAVASRLAQNSPALEGFAWLKLEIADD